MNYKYSESISYLKTVYSKTSVKRPLSKRPKIGFHDQLLLNAGQSIAERGAFCNTFDLQS